ncbi:Uma2 family endonuclease [Larkinella sp.]|uniref:Uma2 family endonuclease n=1 Tax=Larkinella sp. TaxID=2034517 RepID=UPI003BA95E3B
MEVEIKKQNPSKAEPKNRLTVAEYQNLEFDDNDTHLYELIDGELVRRSAPAPKHQRLSRNISFAIHQHITENKLGEVLYSPIDVFFDDYNVLQPDVVFIPKENASIITNNGIEGIPALVVEIISPSSIVRDRVIKKDLYERFGVPEYWLVDPANQEIEIYALEDGRYKVFSAASVVEGELVSKTLAGFRVDLKRLFE